jgi:putative ABC transport system ATP-binding protein
MNGGRVVCLEALQFGWTPKTTIIDIDHFLIEAGEKVFLQGPSGSGKSTLLGLICGVLVPRIGRLEVAGIEQRSLSGGQRDAFRAAHLGVIFQMFNLLPYLSVLGNVLLPCRFSARRATRASARGGSTEKEARRLLGRLGLDDSALLGRAVNTLSVGQQQRVAAARALIGGPELVIADEPTSALDADRRDIFIDLLIEECADQDLSLLFVSHDSALSPHFDRTVDLRSINRAIHEPAARAS